MDKKAMSKIIDFVKQTDLVEFSLVIEDSKICFKRQAGSVKGQAKEPNPTVLPESSKQNIQKPVETAKKASIKSLMVGTFHTSISDDRPPFVVEGGKVAAGQKVGVIEAMKVMKDVICTVNGKISKRLVDNASHVEYGQELFLVELEK